MEDIKSNKNILQEYYQKRGANLPAYKNDRINGIWFCNIKLPDGKGFVGTGSTKKDADQDAARIALQYITDRENCKVIKFVKEIIFDIIVAPRCADNTVLLDYPNYKMKWSTFDEYIEGVAFNIKYDMVDKKLKDEDFEYYLQVWFPCLSSFRSEDLKKFVDKFKTFVESY
ncbi:MAG TPA: putative dsRNA-binding protein [Saprospiraceae bacterium]|nr:putative dsRNA-binding protein [Saprospiraceae bacterium]